LADDLPPL